MKVHCVTDFFFYVAIKLLPYPPTLGLRVTLNVSVKTCCLWTEMKLTIKDALFL